MSEKIRQYTLSNRNGIKVGVSNLGATITEVMMPDKQGRFSNVVLSYPKLSAYVEDAYYVGATLGRYANRIKNGNLKIDGRYYQLSVNEVDKHNHLHGGYDGFHKKVWEVILYTGKKLELHYLSESGEEGFPGKLAVTVTFTLTDRDELWIEYGAQTDSVTVVNISNHSYFNLSGSRNIGNHFLQLYADYYTPTDDHYIPTGKIANVRDTLFDLRKGVFAREIMKEIITVNYAFQRQGEIQLMATVREESSGRQLEVSGTQPGLQVYFGNYLADPFLPFQGLCLEPQHYPDSPNQGRFPSTLLKPGERYEQQVCYRFTNF